MTSSMRNLSVGKHYAVYVFLLYAISLQCVGEERNFFLEFGLHDGGDRIPTPEMTDRWNPVINSGELVSVSLGHILPITDHLEFTPSIGLRYDWSSSLFYGTADWLVAVVNLPFVLRTPKWGVGLGYTYHYKPTLTIRSNEFRDEWRFEDSIGLILELDYYYSDDATIGIHYTEIEYTLPTITPVKGNNIALVWRTYFDFNTNL